MLKPAGPSRNDEIHPLSGSARAVDNGGSPLLENAHSWLVLATLASVVLSTILGVRFISPLLHAAAIVPFYHAAMRRHLHHLSAALVIRWGVTLFASVVLVGVFLPARVAVSIGGAGATTPLQQWITGAGHPPADFPYMLWGMLAFLAGTALTGGVVGLVIGAVAIGGAGGNTLFLLEHGTNVLLITITAVPPWQLCLFASGALLFLPGALPLFDRIFKSERIAEGKDVLRRFMIIGGATFLLSLVLRVVADDFWHQLLRRFTTF